MLKGKYHGKEVQGQRRSRYWNYMEMVRVYLSEKVRCNEEVIWTRG